MRTASLNSGRLVEYEVMIYLALIFSVFARVAGGLWPEFSSPVNTVAGLSLIVAYGGFAVVYVALLLSLPAAKRI